MPIMKCILPFDQSEPDRLVLLGSRIAKQHAASAGKAIPPQCSHTGQALFMELGRVFGLLIRKGWEPRRSLGFVLWGSIDERESIGSDFWVADNARLLQARGNHIFTCIFIHI
jgi:N-acetylated-alpha-linked acidic dipeptidase